MGLGGVGSACDRRFEFDTESGGASGMAGSNGGSGRAGAPLVSGGGGGAAGDRAAGGEPAQGDDDDDDDDPIACGTAGICPAPTRCAAGQCVQCVADADCAVYGLPRCQPARHRCVTCTTTADCGDGFACDSLANHCLKICAGDLDCLATAHGCDEQRHVCYACDEDRECATSAVGPLCATDGSGCVQCRTETDCRDKHCDQLSGRCVECRDGADCASQHCDPMTLSCLPE
ncbi:MAG TPA: hypothetical protein VEQ59_05805 [Polyangiaceae bacterium]|nr:hypothetical protein [Polyangiaceae bacterium]